MSPKMTPYILIATGAVLLISGILMLLRPATVNANTATTISATETTHTAPPAPPSQPVLASQPESERYERGYEFEKWVVAHTNKKYWKMEEWQGDKYHDGKYAASNRNPDMLFTVQVGDQSKKVAIECKWRKDYFKGGIDWATDEQIGIYNRFAKDKAADVFVVLGVGGTPSAPFDVYILPLNALKNSTVKREYLQSYRQQNKSGNLYYDFSSGILQLGQRAGSI